MKLKNTVVIKQPVKGEKNYEQITENRARRVGLG